MEQEIQKACLDYLSYSGYYAFKVHTGGIYDQNRGVYRTIHTKGLSDVIAIKNGLVFFIEIKSETGRQSDNQKDFEFKIKEKGGYYILVRSVEELESKIYEITGERSLLINQGVK